MKSWLDNDIIGELIYKRLRCSNGNLPRSYDLSKIHTSFPLRFIVSIVGSPLYNIANPCFLQIRG